MTDLYALNREEGRKVYHLGSLGPLPKDTDMALAHHLAPFVTDENTTIPILPWNGQYHYRPTAPRIVRSPAEIVAAKRMFPFGNVGIPVPAEPPLEDYTPGGAAGIIKYFPQTGGRRDIGLITDPSAYFMLGGNGRQMIAWALAAAGVPVHFRDEAIGLPINLLKYPKANANDLPGLAGSPFLVKGPANPDPRVSNYSMYGGGWTPQQAHYPELWYLAYLATGDLGFLEDGQYHGNFMVLTDAAKSTTSGAIISGELRGVAWAFRNLFMLWVALKDQEAKGPLPSWLVPSSYAKALIDQSLAFYDRFRTDPKEQTFRLFAGGTRFSPWMADYLSTAFAFGVLVGYKAAIPLYLWSLGNQIARSNGTSGYPVALGTSYRLNTVVGGQDQNLPRMTWAQAAVNLIGDFEVPLTQAQLDAAKNSVPFNGNTIFRDSNSNFGLRAALVMAKYLDNLFHATGGAEGCDVRGMYPELDTCVANYELVAKSYPAIDARWSVVSTADGVPNSIPTQPDPLPPPPVPPPANYPRNVHGIVLRLQDILAKVQS